MQTEIAAASGFCFGVKRAIELTENALERYGAVRTLGPLIHNRIVTDSLAARGVGIAETPGQARGEALVIRSHGVTAQVMDEARRSCAQVIDATCPFVAKIQALAAAVPQDGALVVLGDRNHPR